MSSEFLDSYIENSASDIEETVPELLQRSLNMGVWIGPSSTRSKDLAEGLAGED
jgi:hypothetical protein